MNRADAKAQRPPAVTPNEVSARTPALERHTYLGLGILPTDSRLLELPSGLRVRSLRTWTPPTPFTLVERVPSIRGFPDLFGRGLRR